jgi:hypothetical protein
MLRIAKEHDHLANRAEQQSDGAASHRQRRAQICRF